MSECFLEGWAGGVSGMVFGLFVPVCFLFFGFYFYLATFSFSFFLFLNRGGVLLRIYNALFPVIITPAVRNTK